MSSPSLHATGAGQGTLGSYLAGFFLAVLLTLIAFGLVMSGVLSPPATLVAIFVAAVVQILVHLHYFLHLDRSSEQRWNLAAIVFTAVIIGLLVGGSIWIMFNLRQRTMDTGALPTAVTRPVR